RHVMNVHMHKTQPEAEGELEIVKMKKYISYAKLKCAPRLSDEAIEKLSNYFVTIRDDVKRLEQDSKTRSSIPITVRQLEAIIRISESLAKVTLSPCVSEEHVDEAMRLFKSSTVNALQVGEAIECKGFVGPDSLISTFDANAIFRTMGRVCGGGWQGTC
ncbi:21439_t:CDS:2, partial [Entrophospora sp. SA101]